MSTTTRPYKVIVGASFAGKPAEYKMPKQRRQPVKDFLEGSDIAKWKQDMIAWPKAFPSRGPGEDFFYVQTVRLFTYQCASELKANIFALDA